ncbi:MAG: thiamine-phosphate kinase [Gammaproteobacteria bacterium]|nr:MAG: thiamine-phosphate kinase [Gammaproteobacteria bacterium]
MDEFALIDRFFANRGPVRADVRLGIGDDAAITRVDAGSELVIATDTLVEGTHFLPGTVPRSLGYRCLAVNLSDLAAMGAEPLWCTLSLTLPDGAADWVGSFAEGFMELAERFEIALIGGDTVRGPLAMTVTVHGRVDPGCAIRRAGAGAGDGIFVTGTFGAAAAGLASLRSGDAGAGSVARFLYPSPRIDAGRSLVGIASAMIDVSDGLHVDLARLLAASGLGATLAIETLPLPATAEPGRAVELALTGGDDYELCFTVPADRSEALELTACDWDCAVTRLGETHAESGLAWTAAGKTYPLPATGFRHFGADVP